MLAELVTGVNHCCAGPNERGFTVGNTVPMHLDCHRIKTFGRRRSRGGGDSRRIAKMRRIRMLRNDGPPRLRRSLTYPYLVRSPDGSVNLRDGTEWKMR